MLAFSFLSLGKGALLTSARPLFVLRQHHCENTLLEALTAKVKNLPLSVKIGPDPTEQMTTKIRVARQGRNATAISAHIWMILHGLQFLCHLPNDVEMPRNADIPISQLILLHAFPSYFSVQPTVQVQDPGLRENHVAPEYLSGRRITWWTSCLVAVRHSPYFLLAWLFFFSLK